MKKNEKLIKSIPREIRNKSHDSTTPYLSLDQEFTVDIPDRDEFTELDEADYDVNCYTDGSKINELAGAGIVVKSNPDTHPWFH